MPRAVVESLGLFRTRLHPEGTPEGQDGWWEVAADPGSATTAVEDMVEQLHRSGWHVLDGMLTTEGMLEQLRRGSLGDMKRENFGIFFARAEALLLMDKGPSDALEEMLRYAREQAMPQQHDSAERFDAWVRAQAARPAT